ncbi:transmembrane protein 179-like [Mytilus californianus]|uniref:transmembrane protein 179-like n=1 Tax=Mytilus californianus TaxID=6549 RepID=UPI0022485C25|nr:transmembrane protein 179-like [Mytilus californianus]
MAVVDIQLLVQTVLYFCIFLSGFAISIPVGVNTINFDGICILYADFEKGDANFKFRMRSSSRANCNFPVYMSVFACIFYGLTLGCYNAYAVRKSRANINIGSEMWVMPFILINSTLSVMVLVSASMISVGYKVFCDRLKEYSDVKSCGDGKNIKWTNTGTSDKFTPGNYANLLTVAQIACWTACLLFLLQVALGILRFHRNRRLRQSSSDRERIGRAEPTA